MAQLAHSRWPRFPDEESKAIAVLDVAGRTIAAYQQVAAQTAQLPTDRLARGVYWVHIRAAGKQKLKKLIIQ